MRKLSPHRKELILRKRQRRYTLINFLMNQLRAELGGKCSRCGYDEFKSALQFHHLDPAEKDYSIRYLVQKAAGLVQQQKDLDILYEELKKCVLLCSNCHDSYHAGEWSYENLPDVTRDRQRDSP